MRPSVGSQSSLQGRRCQRPAPPQPRPRRARWSPRATFPQGSSSWSPRSSSPCAGARCGRPMEVVKREGGAARAALHTCRGGLFGSRPRRRHESHCLPLTPARTLRPCWAPRLWPRASTRSRSWPGPTCPRRSSAGAPRRARRPSSERGSPTRSPRPFRHVGRGKGRVRLGRVRASDDAAVPSQGGGCSDGDSWLQRFDAAGPDPGAAKHGGAAAEADHATGGAGRGVQAGGQRSADTAGPSRRAAQHGLRPERVRCRGERLAWFLTGFPLLF